MDFEKYSNVVEGAWLNKTGTIVALKWITKTAENKKTEIINAVSIHHNVKLAALAETEIAVMLNHFQIVMNGIKARS